jgi:predicted GNAT superfamily acetyltransferase
MVGASPLLEWSVGNRHFIIRDAQGDEELHAVEEIQKEVWGFSDLDVVPHASLVAAQWAGGMVLGAFEGHRMVGFVYGFPGYENGRVSIHSHMLAVRPDSRNFRVGFFLKLAQRQRALSQGINEITWTFDPLQSLNAHLNFSKLGVISQRYIVNFYGEATSSHLHQGFGTDRLWVRWLLTSERVKQRIQAQTAYTPPEPIIAAAAALVQSEGGLPKLSAPSAQLAADSCVIEIPNDIIGLKQRDLSAACAWREATRAAFLAAIDAGFLVEDFLKLEATSGPRWFYLLSRHSDAASTQTNSAMK